jgi:polyhydroxyalkanoate synthesis regulator phasin
MSKKKTSKQSESHLPDGGFVPTTGFNYGLDGFDFDTDYGEGIEDGAVHPEAYGMADLPDGMLPEAPSDEHEAEGAPNNYTGPAVQVSQRSGPLHQHMGDPWGVLKSGQVMDGEENLQLGKESALADLDWLDPTLEQDEDRLPVNPVDKAQAALEDAWMKTRTNGLELIPNKNKEIERYQAEVRDPGQVSGLPGVDNVKAAMMRAMRRSACGSSLEALLKEAAEAIGRPDPTARALANLIADEHGLAGNVFIRASAFPGMHNGKWDKVIKKKCLSAAYIIAEPKSKMAAFDNYLGKKVVSSIDWDEALEVYTPRLKAVGIKVAGSSDPRSFLKAAFLQKRGTSSKTRTAFVTHKTPVETVGLAEAKAKFAASKSETQKTFKGATLDTVLQERAQKHVLKLVQRGVLTKDAAREIVTSDLSPKEMLARAASTLKAQASEYQASGIHTKDKVSYDEVRTEWAKSVADDLKKTKLAQAKEHVESLVGKGQITRKQANKLLKSDRNAGELVHAASHVVSLNASKRGEITSSEVKEYTGKVYTQLISENRASKTSSVDVRKLIKWARIQMSEGVLGKDFDDLIAARFSKTLVEAAGHELIQIREAHEGLSGQVYVDTAAYASPEGTKGCEKGATRHRANGLKFALCMPRCGTCKFANALPDGTSVCQKYNKILVDEAPVENVKQYQAEAIRLAGASDAEITASLFTNNYDPTEFSLANESMSHFDFNETPEHDQLSGVFFGGMSLGEDE